MSFTYRENQNTPLTWAQLDGNFREVENVQREVSTQVMAAAASAESATAASAASQSSAELAEEMARISVVRWCGNSTTPPTTRLDGSPLEISDEYGNLTDNLRYNWTGTAWVALNSSAQALEAALGSSLGSDKIGYTDPVAPAFLKFLSDMKSGEPVTIMRAIPKAQHAAIYDQSSIFDVSATLNSLFLDGYKFTAPRGSFYIGAQTVTAVDGFMMEGAGMGYVKNISRKQASTRFWSDQDITLFKTDGSVYPMFKDMLLDITVPHSKPHVLISGGAKGSMRHCRVNGINNSTPGSGLKFDGGSMGEVDWSVFDNAGIDVNTWDVKITNSWVWANSKPWGIRTVGSIGNLLIQGTDIVPPLASVPGKKAGIYLTGAALQPRIIGCYGDGNATLDCGPFILAENGVIGLQVIGGTSNLLDEGGIILDSIIAPKVTGHTFYNGNNTGARSDAADIVLRQQFAQPLEKPLISGNTHIQTVARATPAPAVLVKAGTQRVGMRIIDGTIVQPGGGSGYTDVEILMEDGAFNSSVAGSLAGNAGSRRQFKASASTAFATGDTFKSVALGVTLAYLPRIDQVRVNIEGVPLAYRVQVVNTSTILVAFPAAAAGGTIHVSVSLD